MLLVSVVVLVRQAPLVAREHGPGLQHSVDLAVDAFPVLVSSRPNRFGSIRAQPVRFGLVRFCSVLFGFDFGFRSFRFGSVQVSSFRFGFFRIGPFGHAGLFHFGSVQSGYDLIRFDSLRAQ